MQALLPEIEKTFIHSFVQPAFRDKYVFMLSNRRRLQHLIRLYHHFDFKAKQIEKINVKDGDGLWKELQKKSASATCHVISTDPSLDGKTLAHAMFSANAYRWREASVYIFDARNLALFLDEEDAYLLDNTVSQNG